MVPIRWIALIVFGIALIIFGIVAIYLEYKWRRGRSLYMAEVYYTESRGGRGGPFYGQTIKFVHNGKVLTGKIAVKVPECKPFLIYYNPEYPKRVQRRVDDSGNALSFLCISLGVILTFAGYFGQFR